MENLEEENSLVDNKDNTDKNETVCILDDEFLLIHINHNEAS
jgi:hypothetical protein